MASLVDALVSTAKSLTDAAADAAAAVGAAAGGSGSSSSSLTEGDLSVSAEVYGTHQSGAEVKEYTLRNAAPGGISVRAIDYGAIITGAWESGKPWFNSLVGRNANRISRGLFSLDGQAWQLELNNHGNNLHTSAVGFNARCMRSHTIKGADPALGPFVGVEMRFDSPDGDNGFPGALGVVVRYVLFGDNTFQMSFEAELTSGGPTIVNMCNHAYWNLSGSEGRQSVLDHELRVRAAAITELDGKESMLPTGRIVPVADTPYDFSGGRTIGGPGLQQLEKTLPAPAGYDINYVLSKDHPAAGSADAGRDATVRGSEEVHLSYAARLAHPATGRVMEVWTSAPGLQVYSGNFLGPDSGVMGRGSIAYPKHAAVCLETQIFPDAVNHAEEWKNYPSGILRPGEKYVHVTQHRFSTMSGDSSSSSSGSA